MPIHHREQKHGEREIEERWAGATGTDRVGKDKRISAVSKTKMLLIRRQTRSLSCSFVAPRPLIEGTMYAQRTMDSRGIA